MSKYHVKDNGEPAPCHADKGRCPRGGSDSHFKTPEEARENYEKQNLQRTLFSIKLRDAREKKEELAAQQVSATPEPEPQMIPAAPVKEVSPYEAWSNRSEKRERQALEDYKNAKGYFDQRDAKLRLELERKNNWDLHYTNSSGSSTEAACVRRKEKLERGIQRRRNFLNVMKKIGLGGVVSFLDRKLANGGPISKETKDNVFNVANTAAKYGLKFFAAVGDASKNMDLDEGYGGKRIGRVRGRRSRGRGLDFGRSRGNFSGGRFADSGGSGKFSGGRF